MSSLLSRIHNLWRLSEFEPGQPNEEYKIPGTLISMIVKKPKQEAKFFPRIVVSPADKIINEQNDN